MLAMVVNDNVGCLNARGDWATIASMLAPTEIGGEGIQPPVSVLRLLTSAGTSSPAMRLRNSATRASSRVVTGTVIASKIGISQACSTGPDLSAEK